MSGLYARVTKINDSTGRSEYINDKDRQEEIVLQKKSMVYSWEEHTLFENNHQKSYKKNNQALEVQIALPNNLYKNHDKLRKVCDDLTYNIVGENKDYEYAVHWNHNRTNLHIHILFSERENQDKLVPKTYKKDQWRDKTTNKLAKANSENAYLYAKKGDIQKDKNGYIKYETDIFKPKDTKYNESSWIHEKNRLIENVFKKYGYDINYYDKNSPFLAQKKLYKGASDDYIEKAKSWNKEVREYNREVRKHITIEPFQEENYRQIKREVLHNVKEANSKEKKITDKAIELVRDMKNWVKETVITLATFIERKKQEVNIIDNWNEIKNRFSNFFNIENEIKEIKIELENLENDIKESSLNIELCHNLNKVLELEKEAYKGYSKAEYESAIRNLPMEERYVRAKSILEEDERVIYYGLRR